MFPDVEADHAGDLSRQDAEVPGVVGRHDLLDAAGGVDADRLLRGVDVEVGAEAGEENQAWKYCQGVRETERGVSQGAAIFSDPDTPADACPCNA